MTASGQTLEADVGDDAVIETIIEASSRFIDGECSRYFYKNTDGARYYTAIDATCVRTDDLVSVTALNTDDGTRAYSTAWTEDDFDLWPYNAALDGRPYVQIIISPYTHYHFPANTAKGVKVTGVFGWPSIPAQIQEACIMIGLSTYKRRYGENLSSVATISAGGVVITPQDVPATAWAKINPFRRRI
jgi:hypothetical protein